MDVRTDPCQSRKQIAWPNFNGALRRRLLRLATMKRFNYSQTS